VDRFICRRKNVILITLKSRNCAVIKALNDEFLASWGITKRIVIKGRMIWALIFRDPAAASDENPTESHNVFHWLVSRIREHFRRDILLFYEGYGHLRDSDIHTIWCACCGQAGRNAKNSRVGQMVVC
jgi:hypothetical protein